MSGNRKRIGGGTRRIGRGEKVWSKRCGWWPK